MSHRLLAQSSRHAPVVADLCLVRPLSRSSKKAFMNHVISDSILYVIGVAGGISFLIAPFLPRTRVAGSRHYRVALFIAGLATIGWAILGLAIVSSHSNRSSDVLPFLHHYKDICSGVALGILLLEFLSGEFTDAYRRGKQLRKPDANSTNVA
jgi:hypothetical protein